MKIDFSSGDCKKLPNWVKITHQNADMLQFDRKIFLQQVLRKNYNLFYNTTTSHFLREYQYFKLRFKFDVYRLHKHWQFVIVVFLNLACIVSGRTVSVPHYCSASACAVEELKKSSSSSICSAPTP